MLSKKVVNPVFWAHFKNQQCLQFRSTSSFSVDKTLVYCFSDSYQGVPTPPQENCKVKKTNKVRNSTYRILAAVHGDKTNEPGCLKKHLEELFTMYPCLKLLTGDAIFAQRPLLEAIQEYHQDYLFQVKENQGKVLEQMKLVFEDAPKQEPSDRHVTKKKGLLRYVICG